MACRIAGTYDLDPDEQAARCCARPGFDTRTWTGDKAYSDYWLGAPPRYDLEPGKDTPGRADWHHPHEDIEGEGCPGAWYRTPYVASLAPYLRRQDDHGGRIPNPRLDRCDDRLVLEAVALAEVEQEAALGEHLKIIQIRKPE